jgi:hypothetical protein
VIADGAPAVALADARVQALIVGVKIAPAAEAASA